MPTIGNQIFGDVALFHLLQIKKPITNMITITNNRKEKTSVTVDGKEFTIELGCDISISESKPEPTPDKITCWEDAFRKVNPKFYIDRNSKISETLETLSPQEVNQNALPSKKDAEDSLKFKMRLIIAAACGAREFVDGKKNYFVTKHKGILDTDWTSSLFYEGTNYFPTKKDAEEYLQACINSGLL